MRGGGALRTAALLNYLARRYELDAIFFRQKDWTDPADVLPPGLVARTWTIDLAIHSRGLGVRALRNASRFVRGVPPLVDRLAGHEADIDRILDSSRYAVGVIEHLWCAPYQPVLARHCDKVVLNLHNVESILFERRAATSTWPLGLLHDRFAQSSRRIERRWLASADVVLAPSPHDAYVVERLAPAARVVVYPNTIPWVELPSATVKKQAVVFTGNLEYDPNITAIRHFRRRIWPLLKKRHPDLEWRIVGRNPEAVRAGLNGDDSIRLVGEVGDAIAEIASCAVAVVPLLSGSGSRLKIVESWAAGVPVVSTRIGAEGLPARHGEEILIADRDADFADAVGALLDSPDLQCHLGAAGRRLYEKEFTWEKGWERVILAGF